MARLDDQQNMQPFVDRTGTTALTHLSDPTGEIWRRFEVTRSTYVMLDAAGQVIFSGILGGNDLVHRDPRIGPHACPREP